MSGGQSSGSSRRGKKSGSHISGKPKQPQRGLGVAQLEKIRLHSQMEEIKMQAYAAVQSPTGGSPPPLPPLHFAYSSSNTPYGYYPNITKKMGMGDRERSANLRLGEMWNPTSHGFSDSQSYGPLGTAATRHFLNATEDPDQKLSNNWLDVGGSSGQNWGSGDAQDLDLELKL